MRLVYSNILKLSKLATFLLVLLCLLLQTATVTINAFSENDTEFALIDWEEDSDEEEKTEMSNEKTAPPIYSTYAPFFEYATVVKFHLVNQKLPGTNQEIPIPPPELV